MISTRRDYFRTDEVAVWTACREVGQLWHIEVFARSPNGIHYHEAEYSGDHPSWDVLISNALHFGHFSPRPCSLDRPFDPSMTHGVLALLCHWCRVHSVDLETLMRKAYRNEPHLVEQNFVEIVAQAEWEGIEYPTPDDRYQTRRLLFALRDMGYDQIADVLVQAIRRLP